MMTSSNYKYNKYPNKSSFVAMSIYKLFDPTRGNCPGSPIKTTTNPPNGLSTVVICLKRLST